MNKFIFKIDHYFAEFFHNIYMWGGDIATNIFKFISWFADTGIIFLLIGLTLILIKRTRKIGLTIFIAVCVGFLFTNIILKNVIARARPFEDISSDFYKWWLDVGSEFQESYSFPSGHTTATTAFSIAIFLTTNKERSWSILFLPILMASSRIYLMVHYFTDCLGGLLVGFASAGISYLLVKCIYKSKLKLFVRLREFTVFKSDEDTATQQQSSQNYNNKDNYIYSTQAEENSKSKQNHVNTDKSKQSK